MMKGVYIVWLGHIFFCWRVWCDASVQNYLMQCFNPTWRMGWYLLMVFPGFHTEFQLRGVATRVWTQYHREGKIIAEMIRYCWGRTWAGDGKSQGTPPSLWNPYLVFYVAVSSTTQTHLLYCVIIILLCWQLPLMCTLSADTHMCLALHFCR